MVIYNFILSQVLFSNLAHITTLTIHPEYSAETYRDAPIIGSAIGFGRYLGLVDHIGYRFY